MNFSDMDDAELHLDRAKFQYDSMDRSYSAARRAQFVTQIQALDAEISRRADQDANPEFYPEGRELPNGVTW